MHKIDVDANYTAGNRDITTNLEARDIKPLPSNPDEAIDVIRSKIFKMKLAEIQEISAKFKQKVEELKEALRIQCPGLSRFSENFSQLIEDNLYRSSIDINVSEDQFHTEVTLAEVLRTAMAQIHGYSKLIDAILPVFRENQRKEQSLSSEIANLDTELTRLLTINVKERNEDVRENIERNEQSLSRKRASLSSTQNHLSTIKGLLDGENLDEQSLEGIVLQLKQFAFNKQKANEILRRNETLEEVIDFIIKKIEEEEKTPEPLPPSPAQIRRNSRLRIIATLGLLTAIGLSAALIAKDKSPLTLQGSINSSEKKESTKERYMREMGMNKEELRDTLIALQKEALPQIIRHTDKPIEIGNIFAGSPPLDEHKKPLVTVPLGNYFSQATVLSHSEIEGVPGKIVRKTRVRVEFPGIPEWSFEDEFIVVIE